MFKNPLKKLKEFQKELEETSKQVDNLTKKIKALEQEKKLDEIITNIQNNNYSEKLDKVLTYTQENNYTEILNEINEAIEGLDIDYIKKLNQKIDTSLFFRKIRIVILSIFLITIIAIFIYWCPLSPVYQKTRNQRLLNDVLEKHFDELCAEDDAIKAIEKCNAILEKWESQKNNTTDKAATDE